MMGMSKSLLSMDMEGLFEGASALGSLRGSTEGRANHKESNEKADELMAAPSFFLASHFASSVDGGGRRSMEQLLLGSNEGAAVIGGRASMEAKRGFMGSTDSTTLRASEIDDKETELPMFPRRSTRPRRNVLGFSASRSQDETTSLSFNGFSGSNLQIRSQDWPATFDNTLFQPSRSNEQSRLSNFLQVIEDQALPPSGHAVPAPPEEAHVSQDETSSESSRTTRSGARKQQKHSFVPELRDFQVPSPQSSPPDVSTKAKVHKAAVDVSRQQASSRRVSVDLPSAGSKRGLEGSGAHVKYRPDMQKRARDGQEHWLQQVKRLRAQWMERKESSKNPRYQEQVDTCSSLQIKSQHECLLRSLQMAASDGIIIPHPFEKCGPNSFLGWTGFQVVQTHAQEFRARIDSLFPTPLKENTLHTSFRRAGLVPDKWSSGWLGLTPFRFSHDKRVAYAPSAHAAAQAMGL